MPIKQWGNVIIPCGVHTLKCTRCEWKTGKHKQYLYIELWKKPEYNHYAKEKVSYGKIKLFHIPCYTNSDTQEKWYNRFTSTLPYEFLEHLRIRLSEHPSFNAVVGRREVERARSSVYGNIYDYYWENFIESVHHVSENVELTNDDYLRLFQPIYNKKNNKPIDNEFTPTGEEAPF